MEWWNIQVEGTTIFKVVAKLKNVKKNIKYGIKLLLATSLRVKIRSWKNLRIFKIRFKWRVMRPFQGKRNVENWWKWKISLLKRKKFEGSIRERSS